MEAAFRRQRHVDGARADRPEHRLVGDVRGLGHDHLVARVEDALADRVERRLRAREEDDALGRDLDLRERSHVPGDRCAQRIGAGLRHVAGAPGPQGAHARVDDRARRVDVALADAQDDHVLAALDAPHREVVHRPRVGAGATDTVGQRGEAHAVNV